VTGRQTDPPTYQPIDGQNTFPLFQQFQNIQKESSHMPVKAFHIDRMESAREWLAADC